MENPTLEFVTCHSASRSKSNPKALSFAELINERVGGTTIGYHGRVSYLNVAKSWMNAPTKGKEEDVSDDALPPKTSHPRNIPERFTFPL